MYTAQIIKPSPYLVRKSRREHAAIRVRIYREIAKNMLRYVIDKNLNFAFVASQLHSQTKLSMEWTYIGTKDHPFLI